MILPCTSSGWIAYCRRQASCRRALAASLQRDLEANRRRGVAIEREIRDLHISAIKWFSEAEEWENGTKTMQRPPAERVPCTA